MALEHERDRQIQDLDPIIELDAVDAAIVRRRAELHRKRKCPQCGRALLPVLYGMPAGPPDEPMILAGCIIETSELLHSACPKCDRKLINPWSSMMDDGDDDAEVKVAG